MIGNGILNKDKMLCDFQQNQVISIDFNEKNFQIFVKSDFGTHKAIFASPQMLVSELSDKML